MDSPTLFLNQLKLKFGKPGVPSLEECEKMVTARFEQLMNYNKKKKSGDFAATDISGLVRHRVHCLCQQKCSNSKQTNEGNKSKCHIVAPPKEQQSAMKLSNSAPPTSAHEEDSPVFFNLTRTQAERKSSASSDPSIRQQGMLKFMSGGKNADFATTNSAVPNAQVEMDDKMAIKDDPGPFKLASPQKLKEFGPALVIMPHQGDVDAVLVELLPLDVCHREKLRLDSHSMTHASIVFQVLRR
jgi:hypothetical protein